MQPMRSLLETQTAAYAMRQHLFSNLYDRLSTRPFLTALEKRLVANLSVLTQTPAWPLEGLIQRMGGQLEGAYPILCALAAQWRQGVMSLK